MKVDMTPQQALCEIEKLLAEGGNWKVSRFIVEYIEDLKSSKRLLDNLNEFIGIVNPSIDLFVSVAILRSSYTHGQSLTNWKPFLDNVREANKDNPRINRVLIGLNNPYRPVFNIGC